MQWLYSKCTVNIYSEIYICESKPPLLCQDVQRETKTVYKNQHQKCSSVRRPIVISELYNTLRHEIKKKYARIVNK